MTNIELCRAVARRMGLQGSGPVSISTSIPIEQQIVKAVYDTWIDIQSMRQEWRWMRSSSTFATSVGTAITAYPLSTIFAPGYRFRRFYKDTFYIQVDGDWSRMTFLDYDEFQFLYNNADTASTPYDFSIRPWDNAVLIPPAADVYTVSFNYQKSNQLLSSDTTTPEMPSMHHNTIVYGALEKMGVSVMTMQQYDHYSQQYAISLGNLMRDQLPKKTVRMRAIA